MGISNKTWIPWFYLQLRSLWIPFSQRSRLHQTNLENQVPSKVWPSFLLSTITFFILKNHQIISIAIKKNWRNFVHPIVETLPKMRPECPDQSDLINNSKCTFGIMNSAIHCGLSYADTLCCDSYSTTI